MSDVDDIPDISDKPSFREAQSVFIDQNFQYTKQILDILRSVFKYNQPEVDHQLSDIDDDDDDSFGIESHPLSIEDARQLTQKNQLKELWQRIHDEIRRGRCHYPHQILDGDTTTVWVHDQNIPDITKNKYRLIGPFKKFNRGGTYIVYWGEESDETLETRKHQLEQKEERIQNDDQFL